LVEDLLSYTYAAELDVTVPANVDTDRVLQEVLASLDERTTATRAIITSDPLPSVSVHRTHLLQILQNLLSNSIKYHREGVPPVIHVTGEREQDRVALRVIDNGIGIAPEYQERIFGIFKRLHSHAKYPGTGIGLAIVKKIVDRYGGNVRVESAPGQGATFSVTLPA
jgi:light-regulated signal transduction histidine kinase (bacteriophytochrome)